MNRIKSPQRRKVRKVRNTILKIIVIAIRVLWLFLCDLYASAVILPPPHLTEALFLYSVDYTDYAVLHYSRVEI